MEQAGGVDFRIPVAFIAERASISHMTLYTLEKGEPGVSLGIYAAMLFLLGFVDRLADLADVRTDSVALEPEDGNFPLRIRRQRRSKQVTSRKAKRA